MIFFLSVTNNEPMGRFCDTILSINRLMMAKWQSGRAAIVFFHFSENFLTNGGKFALLT